MEKEYKTKFDEIEKLLHDGKNDEAVEELDGINWRKIHNQNAFMQAAGMYEAAGRMNDAKELLELSHERSPMGRKAVMQLAMLCIRMGEFEEAAEYYDEFVEIAPNDTNKYLIRYELNRAQGADDFTLITILEELNESAFDDKWAYELAQLYRKTGQQDKCIEICDEISTYFGEGPYVERALELKMLFHPLNKEQEEKYRSFRLKRDGITEIKANEVLESGEIVPHTIEIPEVEVSADRFNTLNLQAEIKKNIEEIMQATEAVEVSENMEAIKDLVNEIPYLKQDEPKMQTSSVAKKKRETENLNDTLRNRFRQFLSEEYDGQMMFNVPERQEIEEQVEGQMTIEDVMQNWEKTRRAAEATLKVAEEAQLQTAKEEAIREANEIMNRLEGIAPKLDAGLSPTEIMRQEILSASPEAMQAGERVQEYEEEYTEGTMPEESLQAYPQEAVPPEAGPEACPAEEIAAAGYPAEAVAAEGYTDAEAAMDSYIQAGQATDVPPEERVAVERQAPGRPTEDLTAAFIEVAAQAAAEGILPDRELSDIFISSAETAAEAAGEDGIPEVETDQPVAAGPEEIISEAPVPDVSEPEGPAIPVMLQEEVAQEDPGVETPVMEETLPEENLQEAVSQEEWQEAPQDTEAVPETVPEEEFPETETDPAALEEPAERETFPIPRVDAEGNLTGVGLELPTVDPSQENVLPVDPADVEKKKKYLSQATREWRPPRLDPFADADDDSERLAASLNGVLTQETIKFDRFLSVDEGEENMEPEKSFGEIKMEADQEEAERAGDRIAAELDEIEQKWSSEPKAIMTLTDEERDLFSYFIPIEGMERMICRALTDAKARLNEGGTAGTGNIIIQGGRGSGKTTMAESLLKVLQAETGYPGPNVGRISASNLNEKKIPVVFEKIRGGALIIESAGDIEHNTAMEMMLLLENDSSGTVVILEDTRVGIERLKGNEPAMMKMFSGKINIPIFSVDELVTFGKKYGYDRGYVLNELAELALYNRIGLIQRLDRPTYLTEVKEIMDEAIENAENAGLHGFFGRFAARKEDDEGKVILVEKDFQE